MKKKHLLLSLLAVCSLLSNSCSTEFEIAEPWKEISIIYGLLNPNDTAQYIRVNKAFLDENTSAIVMAQQPDSLYLAEPTTVQLRALNGSNVMQTVDLQKINAADEGIIKDAGTFANTPYYLYKTNATINPAYRYEVFVTGGNGTTASAVTDIITPLTINKPNPASPSLVNIVSTNSALSVRWTYTATAAVHDLDIYVKYKDVLFSGQEIIQSVKLNALTGATISDMQGNSDFNLTNGSITYDLKVSKLLELIASSIPAPTDDIRYRQFVAFDFEVFSATNDLQLFTDVGNAQYSLAGSQNEFTYTNINNGYGLFASRASARVSQVYITPASFRTIACSDVTRFLRFAVHTTEASFPDC